MNGTLTGMENLAIERLVCLFSHGCPLPKGSHLSRFYLLCAKQYSLYVHVYEWDKGTWTLGAGNPSILLLPLYCWYHSHSCRVGCCSISVLGWVAFVRGALPWGISPWLGVAPVTVSLISWSHPCDGRPVTLAPPHLFHPGGALAAAGAGTGWTCRLVLWTLQQHCTSGSSFCAWILKTGRAILNLLWAGASPLRWWPSVANVP